MIIDSTTSAAEREMDNFRPLSDYSDAEKIGWFDEHYELAQMLAAEESEFNKNVYKTMLINAAEDVLKRKKGLRIYELEGICIFNTGDLEKTTKVEVTDDVREV